LQEEELIERIAGRGKDGGESPGYRAANADFLDTNVLLALQSASEAI
jgi:hypothetical protein